MILKKINKNVDLINSTIVAKTWNELRNDKKYSYICHYEDSIMTKFENSLREHSKKVKQNHLKSYINTNYNTYYYMSQNCNNNYLVSPENSQCIVIPSNDCIYNVNTKFNAVKVENRYENNENILYTNNCNIETQTINTLSPLSSNSTLSPLSSNSTLSPLSSNSTLSPLSSNSTLSPIIQNSQTSPLSEINNQYQKETLFVPLYYTIPTQQAIIYY